MKDIRDGMVWPTGDINNRNNVDDDRNNNDSKDKVLKKVSKETENDDNKDNGDNISLKLNQKPRKNITEQLKSSKNMPDKQIIDAKNILELSKKYSESNAKTNEMIKELRAKIKDREECSKKLMKHLKNTTQKKHKGRLKK